ncbi:HIT domain-containing protein [Alphaproteobacteria bacterium]|nr:HIT domain-containing protein [Alphaproteobacteria bacterium]
MSDFSLDHRLERDTFFIARKNECQIRLMNDSRYRWLVLIPEIQGIRDWHDLPDEIERYMLSLTKSMSSLLKQSENSDKINVASLGNIVPQFHLHLIARHKNDAAWPGPVWGVGVAEPFCDEQAKAVIHMMQDLLA